MPDQPPETPCRECARPVTGEVVCVEYCDDRGAILFHAQAEQQAEQARINELLAEHGITDADALKHTLEDHDRWRVDVVCLDLENVDLRDNNRAVKALFDAQAQQLAAKDAEIAALRESTADRSLIHVHPTLVGHQRHPLLPRQHLHLHLLHPQGGRGEGSAGVPLLPGGRPSHD